MPTVPKTTVRPRRPLVQPPGISMLRVDYEAVYSALDRERRRQNLRYNELAATLAVNPATVCGWGHGVGLSATHLARALAWLGRPLSDFTTTAPVEQGPPVQSDAA